MTLSDLAKYSMTLCVARSLCDSWASCLNSNSDHAANNSVCNTTINNNNNSNNKNIINIIIIKCSYDSIYGAVSVPATVVDNTWPIAALTARSEARYMLSIAISAYPNCLRCPRYFRRNIAMPFGTEKLEWLGYPTVKKFWRYVYSFWQNSRTWQRDGHRMTV